MLVITVFCNFCILYCDYVFCYIYVSSRDSVYMFTQMVEHCMLSCSTPDLTWAYSFIMEVSKHEHRYFSVATQNFILYICCNLANLSLTD